MFNYVQRGVDLHLPEPNIKCCHFLGRTVCCWTMLVQHQCVVEWMKALQQYLLYCTSVIT